MHIYTLGYVGRSKEEFIKLLIEYGIKNVIDISKGSSCQIEYFDKKHLKNELLTKSIKYFYLGNDLCDLQYKDYQSFMNTTNFKIAFIRLKEIAISDATAIICFEKNPSECHRKFIALFLEQEGWQVTHIID